MEKIHVNIGEHRFFPYRNSTPFGSQRFELKRSCGSFRYSLPHPTPLQPRSALSYLSIIFN